MSSETNKSSDTGSGKTINNFGGHIGTQTNQNAQNSNFNSTPRITHHTAQGSNSHAIARDYQETSTPISDELRKQLQTLLTELKNIADDYPETEVVPAAEEAVRQALLPQPDIKQVAIYTETLKQAAENLRAMAAPVASTALAIVKLLEANF